MADLRFWEISIAQQRDWICHKWKILKHRFYSTWGRRAAYNRNRGVRDNPSHTQLRKQAFNPHSHNQIWYLRALGTARSQKSSCQYTADRLHSYLLHLLGTRCFLPFLLTFPAISSATEIGPPNSSLHLTESFTGSQIYVEVVRICWWIVKPTTTEKRWRLIGSCEEC